MKKYFSILLMLCVTVTGFSQAPDTLTPEKKARYQIGRIRDNTTRLITPLDFRNAFSALANMSVRRVPYLSMKELRDGMADTARAVQVNEGARSGTFRYDPADVTSLDDSALVIRVGNKRFKRVYEGPMSVKWFGVRGDSSTNDYPNLQKAINRAAANIGNMNPIKGNYAVEIPAGTYKVNGTLKVPIQLRLKITGHVQLIFQNAGVGLWIYNSDAITDKNYYKEMYTRGDLIDVSNGTLNVFHYDFFKESSVYNINADSSIPRSRITAGTIGIKIGRDGSKMVPRWTLSKIGIAGFDVGIDFDCSQNYMALFYDLHIEGNRSAVRFTSPSNDGTSNNAGEMISFIKCRFAGSDSTLLVRGSNIDMNFTDCHFDFVTEVMRVSPQCNGFFTAKFNSCYFERVVDAIFHNRSTKSNYRSPEIYFNTCTALNGRKTMFRSLGKSTRVFFDRFGYRIDNGTSETNDREAWNSLDSTQVYLVQPNVGFGLREKNLYRGSTITPVLENNVANVWPYWQYNAQPVGATTLLHNTTVSTNVASQAIVADGMAAGTQALKVTSSPGLAASFRAGTKQKIPVQRGDAFAFNLIYKVKIENGSSVNQLSARFRIKEYNELGELLNTTSENIQTDTYATNKWRPCRYGEEIIITNRNTRFIDIEYTVAGWVGELYIDTIIIDKKTLIQ